MKNENQVRKTLKKLKGQRDESEKEIEQLRTQLTAAQQSISASSEEAVAKAKVEHDRDSTHLRTQLDNSERYVRSLQADKGDLEAEVLKLTKERDEARASAQAHLQVIEQHETKIGQLLKVTEDADIKRYRKRVHEKTEEVDRLTSQLRETEKECRVLAMVAQNLQAEVERLQGTRKAQLPTIEQVQQAMSPSAPPEAASPVAG